MKPWRLALSGAVLLSILLATGLTTAGASGIPGTGWWTGEQVQNVDPTNTATVSVTAYDSATTNTYASTSQSLAPGASYTFVPSSFSGMPSGFTGSAVVSANTNVLGIVGITNQLAGSLGVQGGTANEEYQGVSPLSSDTSLNFPLAKNNFYGNTTWFFIQNAGSASASVTIYSSIPGCSSSGLAETIGANQMVAVSPADISGCTSGNTAVGGLTVSQPSTGQPLAGVSVETLATVPTNGVIGFLSSTNGFAPSGADSIINAPIIKKFFYNRWTGFQIQNADTTTIQANTITVTYNVQFPAGGCSGQTVITEKNPVALAPGQSWTTTAYTNPLCSNSLASATASTSTGQKISGIVNEVTSPGVTPFIQTTYYALPNHWATAKISAPLYKENFYGRYSGIEVFSLSGSPATFTLTLSTNTGKTVVVHNTSPATSFTFFNLSQSGGEPGVTYQSGSASDLLTTDSGVIITSASNIAAIVNEMSFNNGTAYPTLNDANYEGFYLQP